MAPVVVVVACPLCRSKAGTRCVSPWNQQPHPWPHVERIMAANR